MTTAIGMICSCVRNVCWQTRRNSIDSFEWSKKYDILSISRLYLFNVLALTSEQVTSLTDKDMFRIADIVRQYYSLSDFNDHVRFIARTALLEKQWKQGELHE